MKKLKILLSTLLIAAMLPVYAFANTAEYENEPTVFTFEEAVQLAFDEMLILSDLDRILRDLQEPRRELNVMVRDMENGTFREDTLRELNFALGDLDWNIRSLQEQQNMMNEMLTGMFTMPDTLPDLPTLPPGTSITDAIGEMMSQMVGMMAGMIVGSAQIDMAVGQMQAARPMIIAQIEIFRDDDLYREMVRETRHMLNDFDRNLDMIQLQQDQIRLGLEYGLRTIVLADMELTTVIEAIDAELALAAQRIDQMAVLYELGMVSSRDITAARHGLSSGHLQLDELRRTQQNLRQSINELIGQPLLQETIIHLEIETPEIPENFVEQAAELAATLPEIRLLQFELANAQDARWVYAGNRNPIRISDSDRRRAFPAPPRDPNAPIRRTDEQEEEIARLRNRIALNENVERAEAALNQALRSAEATIIRAHMEFTGLVAQLNALYLDLDVAHTELEIAYVNYELGLITPIAIEEAYMAISRIQQSISRLYNQKWQLAFRLENPSLL